MITIGYIKGHGCPLEILQVENSLETLQELVGGYIESVHVSKSLNGNYIDIIVNEEGRLLGLDVSAIIYAHDVIIADLCGPIIFTSHDETGETVSLTNEQIDYLQQICVSQETMLGKLINIPY